MLVSLSNGHARVGLTLEPAKILVVDDEKSILLLLKEALTQWGYQVTTAPSAVEGLELLKNGLFDALISDIRMPDMSGLDLLREIRKQDETIEVVMMTGYPTIASAVQALKEGAYDYLSKPLILDELRHLMARMMERRFLRGEVHTLRARPCAAPSRERWPMRSVSSAALTRARSSWTRSPSSPRASRSSSFECSRKCRF